MSLIGPNPSAPSTERGVSVICRDCWTLVSGAEAGDRVKWGVCRDCSTTKDRIATLEAQLAEECARAKALEEHLMATGDDALKDLLRQYLNENDLLAETAGRLTAQLAVAEQDVQLMNLLEARGVRGIYFVDGMQIDLGSMSLRSCIDSVRQVLAEVPAPRPGQRDASPTIVVPDPS